MLIALNDVLQWINNDNNHIIIKIFYSEKRKGNGEPNDITTPPPLLKHIKESKKWQ